MWRAKPVSPIWGAADPERPGGRRGRMLVRTEISVDAALAGERLDRALAASLPELSRSRVQALLREGMIADADGTVSDGSRRVRPGDRYTIDIPPPEPAEPEPQEIPLVVVH